MTFLEKTQRFKSLPGYVHLNMASGYHQFSFAFFKKEYDQFKRLRPCISQYYYNLTYIADGKIHFWKNNEGTEMISFEEFYIACPADLQRAILFNLDLFG